MNLGELIKKGGVFYDIEGTTPKEALCLLVSALPPLKSVSPELLLKAMLEREELMPTSIGNGVAIPHPRNPLIDNEDEQFATLAFLKQPLDWNALDRKPVEAFILIVSASAKMHLQTLSRLTYFCRDEGFRKLLKNKASADDIIKYINDTEAEWK
ncbi:MAG: PTS sugar transporter subunit IIA [Treponema sp.]|jgi:PTS system nitrogen regulatory IIA component|nr:PTS sugar transporter subunit IIA [Treponema sp.]